MILSILRDVYKFCIDQIQGCTEALEYINEYGQQLQKIDYY